jgi:hypothetical protein
VAKPIGPTGLSAKRPTAISPTPLASAAMPSTAAWATPSGAVLAPVERAVGVGSVG